jgi:hypothetical protein
MPESKQFPNGFSRWMGGLLPVVLAGSVQESI